MGFPVGDTYFGHVSSSSIDYVATYAWQRRSVARCSGLRRANIGLKLFAKKRLQDHVPILPILMRVQYSFDFTDSRPEGVRWTFDRLAQA
eukprot:6592584-Pyramimonas_sp.AAC.1